MNLQKPVIVIIGHDKNAEEVHLKMAESVGCEIAKRGGIVLSGGKKGGVPEYAAIGASRENGISVAINPSDNLESPSKYFTMHINTGMGFARNQIIGLSADALIVIGGGVGTFCEAAYAYAYSKPVIVIESMNSILDDYVGKYLDGKKTIRILNANSAKDAVEKAFDIIEKNKQK